MRNNRKNTRQTFYYTLIALVLIIAIVLFITSIVLIGIFGYNALINFGNCFEDGWELVRTYFNTDYYSYDLRDSMLNSLYFFLAFIIGSGLCIWLARCLWKFLTGSNEEVRELYHFIRVRIKKKWEGEEKAWNPN